MLKTLVLNQQVVLTHLIRAVTLQTQAWGVEIISPRSAFSWPWEDVTDSGQDSAPFSGSAFPIPSPCSPMPPPISLHPIEFVEEPRFWVVSELRTGSRNLCIWVWLASSTRNDNIYDDMGLAGSLWDTWWSRQGSRGTQSLPGMTWGQWTGHAGWGPVWVASPGPCESCVFTCTWLYVYRRRVSACPGWWVQLSFVWTLICLVPSPPPLPAH